MAGMGPPPKPSDQRARRNAGPAMTRLPAAGRQGRAPKWPLDADVVLATKLRLARAKEQTLVDALGEDPGNRSIERRLDAARERAEILQAQVDAQKRCEAKLWRELWATPQAVEWERLRWHRDVALYVRHQVLAELGDLDSAKEARQRSDRLGLTPQAMLRLRWAVEDGPASAIAAAPVGRRAERRGRFADLRVVDSATG